MNTMTINAYGIQYRLVALNSAGMGFLSRIMMYGGREDEEILALATEYPNYVDIELA